MFQDLNIDSEMLDANENYFVSTYITLLIQISFQSASDVNTQRSATRISLYVTPGTLQ